MAVLSFHLLESTVEKIFHDQAMGILLCPVWKSKAWFQALNDIAVKWWDIPPGDGLFQSLSETVLPSKRGWNFRAVVFDAFRTRDDVSMRQLDVVDTFCPLHSNYLVPPVDPPLPWQLRGVDWESLSQPDLVRIASVIASTSQHPHTTTFANKILRQFDSELHVPKLARDVNPANRGFYGKATIEPKDNARPMVRKPFRTLGEREEAL